MRRIPARWLNAAACVTVSAALAAVLAENLSQPDTALLGQPSAPITVLYPADGSLFPPEITPPTFLWSEPDQTAIRWQIAVTFEDRSPGLTLESKGEPIQVGEIDETCAKAGAQQPELSPEIAGAHTWKPDEETWAKIKQHSVERPATIRISGFPAENTVRPLSVGRVRIRTAKDTVGAPIFYRDVPLISVGAGEKGVIMPLPSGALPLIEWRLRYVGEPRSRTVMRGLPTCANCHSFSRDGTTLGMDVDGPANDKGLYGLIPINKHSYIRNEDVIKWQSFSEEPAAKRFGFMSQVSPDGKYVVTSIEPPGMRERYLEKRLYNGFYKHYGFGQVFFPTRGILAWYSRKTGKLQPLPGADDPRFVQAGAFWSPDGKYLVFSRAEARDPYPPGRKPAQYANDPNETQIQYDLYRIPFNDGKGGTPEPIAGGSRNGMSNNFPKVSPDGKWIVFVRNRNGLLMRPDSQLFIVPFQGGKERRLQCNTPRMNSWHSFSPNGRWLVFSSKGRSLYTQLYLTHIDEKGDASPAILIDDATAANRAVNIPEFVDLAPGALEKIEAPATEFYRLIDLATELARDGRHEDAIAVWRRAVALEPEDARAHYYLGVSLHSAGHGKEAISEFQRSVELKPDNAAAYTNLAVLHGETGNQAAAMEYSAKSLTAAVSEWRKMVELYPEEAKTHFNLALALDKAGQLEKATEQYQKAIELDPQNASAYTNLAVILARTGRLDEAIAQLEKCLAVTPDNAKARGNLGAALIEKRRFEEAIEQCRKAVEIDPDYPDGHGNLATALALTGRLDEAILHLEKAVSLNPAEFEFRYKLGRFLAANRTFEAAIPHLEEAVKLSGAKEPMSLEMLAAMYSEVGRLGEAVQTARQALTVATEQNNQDLANELRTRLSSYEAMLAAAPER